MTMNRRRVPRSPHKNDQEDEDDCFAFNGSADGSDEESKLDTYPRQELDGIRTPDSGRKGKTKKKHGLIHRQTGQKKNKRLEDDPFEVAKKKNLEGRHSKQTAPRKSSKTNDYDFGESKAYSTYSVWSKKIEETSRPAKYMSSASKKPKLLTEEVKPKPVQKPGDSLKHSRSPSHPDSFVGNLTKRSSERMNDMRKQQQGRPLALKNKTDGIYQPLAQDLDQHSSGANNFSKRIEPLLTPRTNFQRDQYQRSQYQRGQPNGQSQKYPQQRHHRQNHVQPQKQYPQRQSERVTLRRQAKPSTPKVGTASKPMDLISDSDEEQKSETSSCSQPERTSEFHPGTGKVEVPILETWMYESDHYTSRVFFGKAFEIQVTDENAADDESQSGTYTLSYDDLDEFLIYFDDNRAHTQFFSVNVQNETFYQQFKQRNQPTRGSVALLCVIDTLDSTHWHKIEKQFISAVAEYTTISSYEQAQPWLRLVHQRQRMRDLGRFTKTGLAKNVKKKHDRELRPATRTSGRRRRELLSTEILFAFPLPPAFLDVIKLNAQDLDRLRPFQYLNDNLVDFYLRWLSVVKYSRAFFIRHKMMIMSSHFFVKLTDDRLTCPKERYAQVARWTAKNPIFDHEFVFIPIVKDLHWSLVILCHPSALIREDEDNVESKSTSKYFKPKAPVIQSESDDSDDSALDFQPKLFSKSPSASKDNDEGNASIGTEDLEEKKAPKVPALILLDSLGSYHAKSFLIKTLKSYLIQEWNAKGNYPAQKIDVGKLRKVIPRAPVQTNGSDCGVFMLQYAEHFIDQLTPTTEAEPSDANSEEDTIVICQRSVDSKLEHVFQPSSFTREYVTKKRTAIKELCNELIVEYKQCKIVQTAPPKDQKIGEEKDPNAEEEEKDQQAIINDEPKTDQVQTEDPGIDMDTDESPCTE